MPADAASLTGLTLAALCCAAAAGPAFAPSSVTVASGQPANLCLDNAPQATAQRAVLVLTAYRPRGDAGGRLSVTADTGETTLIGMFPGGPFEAADPGTARRYLLPGGPESRCWTIDIDGEASANVFLEPAIAPTE